MHYDLANLPTVLGVQADNLGFVDGDGSFEIIGRRVPSGRGLGDTVVTKTGRQPAIMRVAAVALLVAAVCCVAGWVQVGRTLGDGARVEARLDTVTLDLNAALGEFRGDSEDARALLTALELMDADLDAVEADVADIEKALLPVGARDRADYARALSARIDAQRRYAQDLSSAAEKIIARGDIIQRLSEGFGVLDELSAPDLDTARVQSVMAEVQTAVDDARAELRSLETNGVAAYSSEPLHERLAAISGEVTAIRSALDRQDAVAFAASTAAFSELLKADWQALFFAADAAGVDELAEGVGHVTDLQESAATARAELATLRDSLGLVAVICAAAGALTGAMAWLR